MTSVLERAVSLADAWLAVSWRAACASLAALALLHAARPFLRRRASPHAASWLWLVPLVPLALPLAPGPLRAHWPGAPRALVPAPSDDPRALPAPGGAAPGVAAAADEPSGDVGRRRPATEPAPAARAASPADDDDANAGVARARRAARLPWLALVGLLWWSVSLALLVATAVRVAATRALVRSARPCIDAALCRRFARLAREQGAPAATRLLLVERLASPAAAGVLRPCVLVSPEVLAALAPDELEFALRHELAHVRRRDVLVDALVRVVRALWFFHPSAWLAPREVERLRELACDEAAIARGSDAFGAARALLHVIENGRRSPALGAGAVPLTHHQSLEEERVMRLIRPNRPALRGLSPFAAAAVLLGAVVALPGASGAQDSEADPTDPTDQAALGPAAPRRAADRVLAGALRWLVAQQREDGGWSASTVAGRAYAGEFDEVGTTATVLLALHGAPAELAPEGHLAALGRGVRFLDARRDRDGGAFTATDKNVVCVPSHALALRAWIVVNAAHEGEFVADWRDAATRGVRFAESARNPYLGWRYGVRPDGDNDAVITSWMLLALAEARRHGIEGGALGIEHARLYLDVLLDPATGRYGYSHPGEPTSRLADKAQAFPGDAVEFPTAAVLCAKLALTGWPAKPGTLLTSAALLLQKAPLWSQSRGTTDSYYWAFGTEALRHVGGALARSWNDALVEALVEHAEQGQGDVAWWPAVDAWHDPGSEVGMTAMCALALTAAR